MNTDPWDASPEDLETLVVVRSLRLPGQEEIWISKDDLIDCLDVVVRFVDRTADQVSAGALMRSFRAHIEAIKLPPSEERSE